MNVIDGFAAWLDAYQERRLLVLQIEALTNRTTATIAFVLACFAWLRRGENVNANLRAFRELAAAGRFS